MHPGMNLCSSPLRLLDEAPSIKKKKKNQGKKDNKYSAWIDFIAVFLPPDRGEAGGRREAVKVGCSFSFALKIHRFLPQMPPDAEPLALSFNGSFRTRVEKQVLEKKHLFIWLR